MEILICSINEQRYGFQLSEIKRVIPSVTISLIPNAPAYILGAINVHGEIIPVINLRNIWGWPNKEIDINDHFILGNSSQKNVALWVDKVENIKKFDEKEIIPAAQIFPELKTFEFALKDNDEIILLFDLEKLILPLEFRNFAC